MKPIAAILMVAMVAGCQHGSGSARSTAQALHTDHASGSHVTVSNGGRLAGVDTGGTPSSGDWEIVVVLNVYALTVPLGAVSNNAEFWAKIDEDHLDIANHDLQLKNGIRYGVGPIDEWEHFFKPLLDQKNGTSKMGSLEPRRESAMEYPLRTNIEYEDLFYLNQAGELHGRTYQHCDNIFTIAFDSIPTQPGDVRIRVNAMVRDLRYQFVVTDLNNAQEIERRRPDYLFDLKAEADVPVDHFLVVAPSLQATLPFNVGGTFLVHPGNAQEVETVLVLVPKPYRVRRSMVPTAPPTRAKHK